MHEIQAFARYAVFAAFAVSVLIATASWLVRTRRVSPFSGLGRALRAASEPLIRPVETRLVRRGGNPVHAGWWLVIVVTIAGLLLLWLMDWTLHAFQRRPLFAFLIEATFNVLSIALLVRVVGSWFGVFRYSRWMRPAYVLTDWLVEPIRRRLPPTGAIDWSPLVAWLAVWIVKQLVLNAI